ncbi:MAG: cbb3-type cytochrome oxidase assembly protein CcoS [Candidatus Kapabacteria bacterium]|nr:cbb3-type cytochrome oxidase assembly protein CcoS [Ignavibacteriota bacterium]MCW5885332.1 cbb3-type cytochrome oxidase assembly protein CcoS [Candidatus Kapabacteria bacterium]
MSVIIVLMAASLSVAIIFLIAFLWAIRSDQFEDTFTPSMRILNDEKEQKITNVK